MDKLQSEISYQFRQHNEGGSVMTVGKKVALVVLVAFTLSGCKNFYHSSCPGYAGENPEARDGIKSVIETCN
ncbi:hypothetical protein AD951_04970 [Acetobacter malorum]|uniref:Lipoprotein n=1 Tax=Acetobacter malorum TaxID=178901 RepID=A0A149UPL3_9PROT|nr:hypothetical protein [Acetobacter malorum]KXV69825.1 hypothetical protein AD951_04970 [Acetobacter malorum]